jgi:hypothetical protein
LHTRKKEKDEHTTIAEVTIGLHLVSTAKKPPEERSPMTMLGRSKMSLRMEKQKVAGNGAPDGLSRTQCEYTALVVFSNACEAKFSQYSTTDWFSNN